MASNKRTWLLILVAALGYFVDLYDLILFSIVRVASLQDIGVSGPALLSTGVTLLNMQMMGMLIGGILWGILGDKRGRLSVLFGSIAIYSIANIANGFVSTVPSYAALRFVAGIGLAGELGAGITLVSESMSKEARGWGTTVVASAGILGAVAAGLVGGLFHWRIAYFIGGGMGLGLLILRVGVYESGLFEQMTRTNIARGNFLNLFHPWVQFRKYASVILIGLPPWYVIAILVTFSPEFGKAMGMTEIPQAGRAIMLTYGGGSLGGLLSGFLSQALQSRKKVVFAFIIMCGAFTGLHFLISPVSLTIFYTMCFVLGIAVGYWAVFAAVAAEQFGTNIRATAATTVPNFVRGGVVPMTLAFQWGQSEIGIIKSGLVVGLVVITVALLALRNVEETYGKDLDFIEV